MEEKRNPMDQLIQENIYCSRCKIKEAEITCAMCDPFKHFCGNCNEYVHSVPSKKFHVRRKMQDKLLESINNNPINESNLKASNSSNFKLSDNFNKEKFSQVIKDKQSEIKRALENFEFNYSNNRFYNNNANSIDNYESENFSNNNVNCRRNLNRNFEEDNKINNNYRENYIQNLNFTSKEIETPNQDFESINRGRIRENHNYASQRMHNNNLDNSRNNIEKALRNNHSNNSLRGSNDEYEKGLSKSRDNSRRFYNFRRNNTNQEASLNKSPKNLINSTNNITQNIGSSNNYINEIKRIYDKERDDLLNKNFEIEKRFEELKLESSQEIMFLKTKLEETVKNYESEITHINEEHKIFVKKIVSEKELEIRNLLMKNKELEAINQELVFKNNEFTITIQKIKHGFTDKMSEFDLESRQKDKEIIDLKSFYEDRIGYLTNNFNIEKSRIISENEKNIEKLTNGYKESKEKLLSIIKEKEDDLEEIKENHKYEEENVESLKYQISKLNEEITKLHGTIQQQTIQNRNLMELIDKCKSENEFIKNEAIRLEEEHDELIQNNEVLKLEHEKLDRLTKGKLTKRSTSRNNSLNVTKNSILKKASRFFAPLIANIGHKEGES